jgi:hypothetical protein
VWIKINGRVARTPNQPKGFPVDAEITLEESSQWAATKMEPEASRGDAAAFSAAKVFLESADGRAVKGGPKAGMRGQHYLIPFPPKAQIAARGVDLDHEYSDAKEARSKFELTVALGLEQSVNMRAAVGYKSWLGSNMFKFTDVNRSIVHCIRGRRQSPATQWKTNRETDASIKHEDGAL